MRKNRVQTIRMIIREKFVFNTVNNIFILAFINILSALLGPIHSIWAVSLVIIITASVVRDMLGTPVRNFFFQLAVLLFMTVCSTAVVCLPLWASIPVNFITVFTLTYLFSSETTTNMYFPYVLGYLFITFITPVRWGALPPRLLGALISAVVMLAYQFIAVSRWAPQIYRGSLSGLAELSQAAVESLLSGRQEDLPDPAKVRQLVLGISRKIYDRRKSSGQISEAQCALLDAARAMERFILCLSAVNPPETREERQFIEGLRPRLAAVSKFLAQPADGLSSAGRPDLDKDTLCAEQRELLGTVLFLEDCFRRMAEPNASKCFHGNKQSLRSRLYLVLEPSPVRVIYALRLALLLMIAAIPVKLIPLPYGKWLMFTLASVSLPYADDVMLKGKKRFIATLTGGAIAVVLFTVVKEPFARTAAMILVGYLSSFFTDYTGTYSCATVGALGGAVTSFFTFPDIGIMYVRRICYIGVGILIALFANKCIFPYTRQKAVAHLHQHYNQLAQKLLTLVCHGDTSSQQYYWIVLQAHLVEAKLRQESGNQETLDNFLCEHYGRIFGAHNVQAHSTPHTYQSQCTPIWSAQ